MTTWMKRLVTGVAVVLAASSLAVAPAFAATGNQGYAVYRDGVFYGADWHAALMDDPHWNTTTLPVVQAPGGSGYVRWDTWSNFLGGKTYKGTYRPKTAPSSGARDSFVSMGRRLKDEQIPYDWYYEVNYNTSTAGTWVDPGEVTKMRCDGVVEYVYEWYGFRVYGSNDYWDVTRANASNRDVHSLPGATPKNQAQGYLTKVTSSKP
jgi:hypothetical protein